VIAVINSRLVCGETDTAGSSSRTLAVNDEIARCKRGRIRLETRILTMNICKSLSNDRASHGAARLDDALCAGAIGTEILIADDDDSVSNSLSRLLKCQGYSTLAAASGAAALQLALQRRPPIILMDIQMPQMNGIDAARAIKAHTTTGETQIIALSAAPMPQQAGSDLFARILQKPCASAVVMAAIEAAIFQHCFRQVMT
jgi:CheY-like chemotaxis protein